MGYGVVSRYVKALMRNKFSVLHGLYVVNKHLCASFTLVGDNQWMIW